MKKTITFILVCLAAAILAVPVYANTANDIAKPVINLVRNYDDGIHVMWSGSADSDGYYVYRSVNDGAFSKVADVAETNYTDTAVEPAVKYSYKLKAYKLDGTKKVTSGYSGKKSTYRIGATKIIKLENQTRAIKVVWEEVPEADGYKVYRKEGDEPFKLLATKVGSDNTSLINTSPKTGHIYTYLVKPYITPASANYYNYEDNSAETARLPKVTDVVTKYLYGQTLRISWNLLDGDVDGYIVSERNLDTGKAKNYYFDSNVSETTIRTDIYGNYSYTVRAYVGDYKSAFSAKSTVLVKERHYIRKAGRVDDKYSANLALMTESEFNSEDGETLANFIVRCYDEDDNIVAPDVPVTVVITGIDFDTIGNGENIILAYRYAASSEIPGGEFVWTSIPYQYNLNGHYIMFTLEEMMPFYGYAEIANGEQKTLIVNEDHGDLTWSVGENLWDGEVIIYDDGTVEVQGLVKNVVVTATDGEKEWKWLINFRNVAASAQGEGSGHIRT